MKINTCSLLWDGRKSQEEREAAEISYCVSRLDLLSCVVYL